MSQATPVQQGPSDARPRKDKDSTSWMVGVILILLGLAFFLANQGYISMAGNWWAIFIYLASFASFATAWRVYRAKAEFGSAATGSLIWGLVLAVVATIFLFNLAWDLWWPAILIAIGIGIVAGYLLGRRSGTPGHVSEPPA